MKSHYFHAASFLIGFLFFSLSIYQAVVLHYPHFYTSFAFGSWLVLDFVDYKLTRYSILSYFSRHKNRLVLWMFLTLATLFCFLVDYLWGIRVAGMWEWVNYKGIHFLRMYLIMNASFILSMYELFRVIRHFLFQLNSNDEALINLKFYNRHKPRFYIYTLLFGILGLIAPGYSLVFNTQVFVEYIMIFPFFSIVLITDSITYLTGGKPILDDFFKLKKMDFIALIGTSFVAAVVTEILNVFGSEWKYLKMPFDYIKIYDIPVAVFIGWIPLVVGSISIINMVKHVGYIIRKNTNIN